MTLRIVALETTERIGSVAALDSGRVLVERKLPPHQRSAESLAPGLSELLAEVDWKPDDVDLVATCVGPGSFTGLRVGVATAKVFAYCVRAEILGIDTLEVIAAGCPPQIENVSVAVDAQRGQVVACPFQRQGDGWPLAVGRAELLDVDAWLSGVAADTAVCGPVLKRIGDRVPAGVSVLDASCWNPTAATLGRLACHHFEAGRRDDLWQLVPHYSRRTAAEETWEARRRARQEPPAS